MDRKLMQKEVAKLIGVSEDCITYWENGRSEPQIQFMPYIIKFLEYVPITIDTSTIGGKIKEHRLKHGYSFKRMGEVLGVDASTVLAWEKNGLVSSQTIQALLGHILSFN